MANPKILYIKEDLKRYISGKIDISSRLAETSALKYHANSKMFKVYPHLGHMILTCSLITLSLFLLSLTKREISFSNYLGIFAFLSFGYGLISFNNLLKNYFEKLYSYRESLKEGVIELLYLKEYLITYLKDLDYRTQRYFSLMTNNKASNYLLLNNLKKSLQERINIMSYYSNSASFANLKKLDLLLREGIIVCDGIDENSGEMHQISVSKLAEIIDNLVANMEESIKVLEQDIKLDYNLQNDLINQA